MPGPEVAASCRGIDVVYPSGAAAALRGVSAEFPVGQLSVVAGPSGSGKSTLLRVVAGLLRPTAGEVTVAGVNLVRLRSAALRRLRRRRFGFVLQSPADNLLPDLRAIEQVEFAAQVRGADRGAAAPLLDQVGLTDRARSYPAELSGGEQQRVALASATVGGPAVVFADEPTAELDPAMAARVGEALRRLAAEGATLVVASHDPGLIDRADQVIRLSDGRRC